MRTFRFLIALLAMFLSLSTAYASPRRFRNAERPRPTVTAACSAPTAPSLGVISGDNWHAYKIRTERRLAALKLQYDAQQACMEAEAVDPGPGEARAVVPNTDRAYRQALERLKIVVRRGETRLGAPQSERIAFASDTTAVARARVVARVLNDPSGWIGESDYPPNAIAAGASGRVVFSLLVDPSGSPRSCAVTGSSGNRALDDTTCRLLIQRARFEPVRDATGHSASGEFSSAIRWQLPAVQQPAAQADYSPPARTAYETPPAYNSADQTPTRYTGQDPWLQNMQKINDNIRADIERRIREKAAQGH